MTYGRLHLVPSTLLWLLLLVPRVRMPQLDPLVIAVALLQAQVLVLAVVLVLQWWINGTLSIDCYPRTLI